MFIDLNDWHWTTRPSVDDAETAMLAIANSDRNEQDTATWLRQHLAPRDT